MIGVPYVALTLAVGVLVLLVSLPVSWARRARRDAELPQASRPRRSLRLLSLALLAAELPLLVLVELGDHRVGPFASELPIGGLVLGMAFVAVTLTAVALSYLAIPRAQRTDVEDAWPLILLVPAFAIAGCYGFLYSSN